MDTNSGLAAVLAAATDAPVLAAAPMAAARASDYTAADLQSAFPVLCAEIRTEGAAAERERILGIDAIGIAGHDELIASMKADPTVSVGDAGIRVLRAEQTLRGQHLQAVKDVESATRAVKPAPTTGALQSVPLADGPKTPDMLKAEFEASPDLRAEFGSAETYVAYAIAADAGKIRVLGKK